MANVYGYARVSTDRQELSVAAQGQTIKEEYDRRLAPQGLTWGGIFADVATSAKIHFDKRPAGGELLKRIQKDDHVIFVKLDRAFRSVVDQSQTLELMLNSGVKPHFLDIGADASTSVGQLIIRILASVAQWERERIVERTKAALAEKKRRGELVTGRPPLGYAIRKMGGKKKLVLNYAEVYILKQIYEWRLDGLTYKDLSMRLRVKQFKLRGTMTWGLDRCWVCVQAFENMMASGKLTPEMRPDRLREFIAPSASEPTTAPTPTDATPSPAIPTDVSSST